MPLIVFDLDGTLIDSRLDLAESANEVLASYGARPLPVDTVAGMVGEGARVLVARVLEAAGLRPDEPDALHRFLEIYNRRLLNHTRPYTGVIEMLKQARARAALAILTNKPEAPTRRLLEAFGIAALFTAVVGGDSAYPRKPDPGGLRGLMRDAGATTGTTLFVGDSMIDVETARRAGTRICVALYGFGRLRGELVLTGEELLAETPADVTRAIEEGVWEEG